jgi:hypothetical protein
MYNYLNKNSSPKRIAGGNTLAQNTGKGARASIERKDHGRTGKVDAKYKPAGLV